MQAEIFFNELWTDYVNIAPQAQKIHDLFAATDGEVINDHVAFRTFANTPLRLDLLEPLILAMGYERQDSYEFKAKKLRAHSFIHPNPLVPKIFCSELLVEQLSDSAQKTIEKYTAQITEKSLDQSVFWSGRHWEMPSWDDYNTLMAESEYGAWLLAIGVRVNHFTVSINHLTTTSAIREVLERVKSAGYKVNTVGGEVKGTPESLLEQSSTMADRQFFEFTGGDQHEIPTCFYEFAKRHADNQGVVYQGFIEANADKIFESTNG
ncbi:DUF1338 domain-containing protein [Neptunomonas japonica]|uniref:DUF1338 domain-containing protein n=1 Tax=Neptunomonas japonica TaxID=417574 RepID=UPI0004185E01|nr:DUF1338 domain-containing protein [Neptunomonas japonica]